MPPSSDTALRALTDDGAFRVMAVQTTETVRGAIAAQNARGSDARLLAEMLTGAILVRETMAPDHRVQGTLVGDDGRSRIVADAHPTGETRGLVQRARGAESVALREKMRLTMMRTLHDGSIHQGTIEAPASGGVSGALMEYMQRSEQVVSVVAVGCVVENDEVVGCGGFIVQLLPEVGEGPLALMTERLAAFEKIDTLLARGAAAPAELLSEVLYGMPYTQVGESELSFKCQCSEARVVASLTSLPRKDILELISDARPLEISCDYCARDYRVAPETLRGLLAQN